MSGRWQRIYMIIAWTMAMFASFYFAWRRLDAKQHLIGALVGIAILWIIGIGLTLLGRREHKSGRNNAGP